MFDPGELGGMAVLSSLHRTLDLLPEPHSVNFNEIDRVPENPQAGCRVGNPVLYKIRGARARRVRRFKLVDLCPRVMTLQEFKNRQLMKSDDPVLASEGCGCRENLLFRTCRVTRRIDDRLVLGRPQVFRIKTFEPRVIRHKVNPVIKRVTHADHQVDFDRNDGKHAECRFRDPRPKIPRRQRRGDRFAPGTQRIHSDESPNPAGHPNLRDRFGAVVPLFVHRHEPVHQDRGFQHIFIIQVIVTDRRADIAGHNIPRLRLLP